MIMAETFRTREKKKSTGNSKSVFAGINGSAWSEPLVCIGGDFDEDGRATVRRCRGSCSMGAKKAKISHVCELGD